MNRPGELPVSELVLQRPELDTHDPTVYHRDDEMGLWVDSYFHRKVKKGWTNHLHWRFGGDPTVADFETVLKDLDGGVSPELEDEVKEHLGGRK